MKFGYLTIHRYLSLLIDIHCIFHESWRIRRMNTSKCNTIYHFMFKEKMYSYFCIYAFLKVLKVWRFIVDLPQRAISVQCNSDSIYGLKKAKWVSSKRFILDRKLDVSATHRFTFWASLRHYSVKHLIISTFLKQREDFWARLWSLLLKSCMKFHLNDLCVWQNISYI